MATIQGIYITVLGMAILFVALLILMLAAMGLERLFRPKELAEVIARPEEELSSKREKGLVAAIAVTIASLLKETKAMPTLKPEAAPPSEGALSAWKFWGRYRQLMSSRPMKEHRG